MKVCLIVRVRIKCLSDYTLILDRPKLKASEDNKLNVSQILRFILDTVENIVEKGENAGYQNFLLFQ